tara:strand:+ start:49 stop:957 length:909 start_codon:yes stop_codon:yes gene_type:complete
MPKPSHYYLGTKLSKKQIKFQTKFVSPYGYYPWHKLAKEIINEQYDLDRNPNLSFSGLESVVMDKNFLDAPVYFLTDELCKAFIKTDLDKIKLEEKPKIIAPYFIIMQSTNLNNVNYTFVNSSEKQKDISFSFAYEDKHLRSKGKACFHNTHFNWSEFMGKKLKLKDYSKFIKLNEKDKKQMKMYNTLKNQKSIITNFILLCNAQPEIITEEYIPTSVLERKNSFKPNSEDKKSHITWVGKDFTQRIIKVKPKSDEILEKKTGKPKKSHWRRGHWHTILQGPKRQQRKMKWFQPVYVIGNAA